MPSRILAQVDGVVQAATPEEASARFYRAANGAGASDVQTPLYRRPILGLSEPTARFHADYAHRTLGAVSRAQAQLAARRLV